MKRGTMACLGILATAALSGVACRDANLAGPGPIVSGPMAGNAGADTMTVPDSTVHDTLAHGGGKILIDASRDGGVWWFPQWSESGTFDPLQPHQGAALAQALRVAGYAVRELPRPYVVTRPLLDSFDIVVRAGMFGSYEGGEVAAYRDWVAAGGRLLLLADHFALQPGTPDAVANEFGLPFQGIARVGGIELAADTLTQGVGSLEYVGGSALASWPDSAVIVARLSGGYLDLNNNQAQDSGEPASVALLGRMRYGAGRIVFCGDLNLWEWVPSPLLGNVLGWLAAAR